MSNLENNSDSPIWTLYLFPDGKGAQLCCRIGNTSLSREIPGRLARIILLLQRAAIEDRVLRIPIDLQGFRPAKVLARAFEEDLAVDPPEPSTMTAYLYRLCKRLKIADRTGQIFPPLIERVRHCGARLLHPVEICLVGCAPIGPRPRLAAAADSA